VPEVGSEVFHAANYIPKGNKVQQKNADKNLTAYAHRNNDEKLNRYRGSKNALGSTTRRNI
jgi:hypothetical protein